MQKGFEVIGFNSHNDYYNVALGEVREQFLKQSLALKPIREKLETPNALRTLIGGEKPDVIVRCAGQAGVCYLIDNPRAMSRPT